MHFGEVAAAEALAFHVKEFAIRRAQKVFDGRRWL